MSLHAFLDHFYKLPSAKEIQSKKYDFQKITRGNIHILEYTELQDSNYIHFVSTNENMSF